MNNRCYTYFRIVGKFNTDDISHILNLTPEKKWDIGDVIVSEKKQGIALIVKDNDGMYCAMDIDALDKSVTTYSTEDNAVYYCGGTGYFDKLKTMQNLFESEGWHKAKAVLKVHSNIELGGDKRKSSNE